MTDISKILADAISSRKAYKMASEEKTNAVKAWQESCCFLVMYLQSDTSESAVNARKKVEILRFEAGKKQSEEYHAGVVAANAFTRLFCSNSDRIEEYTAARMKFIEAL